MLMREASPAPPSSAFTFTGGTVLLPLFLLDTLPHLHWCRALSLLLLSPTPYLHRRRARGPLLPNRCPTFTGVVPNPLSSLAPSPTFTGVDMYPPLAIDLRYGLLCWFVDRVFSATTLKAEALREDQLNRAAVDLDQPTLEGKRRQPAHRLREREPR